MSFVTRSGTMEPLRGDSDFLRASRYDLCFSSFSSNNNNRCVLALIFTANIRARSSLKRDEEKKEATFHIRHASETISTPLAPVLSRLRVRSKNQALENAN